MVDGRLNDQALTGVTSAQPSKHASSFWGNAYQGRADCAEWALNDAGRRASNALVTLD